METRGEWEQGRQGRNYYLSSVSTVRGSLLTVDCQRGQGRRYTLSPHHLISFFGRSIVIKKFGSKTPPPSTWLRASLRLSSGQAFDLAHFDKLTSTSSLRQAQCKQCKQCEQGKPSRAAFGNPVFCARVFRTIKLNDNACSRVQSQR